MKRVFLDIGNTNCKIFLDLKDQKTQKMEVENKIEKIISELIKDIDRNSEFYISSVVLDLNQPLEEFFKKQKVKYYFLKNSDYSLLFPYQKIDLKELGQDRFVDIIAANQKYPRNIIFDLGTALTVDVVDYFEYKTGMIFPGLESLQKGLFKNTSILEEIKFQKLTTKQSYLTTTTQINSGIIFGLIGAINQYLLILENQINLKQFKVILTGGSFVQLQELLGKEELEKLIHVKFQLITDLNYQGLKIISQKIKI